MVRQPYPALALTDCNCATDGHLKRYFAHQEAQREAMAEANRVPQNRKNTYEVYGNRKCVESKALEIARLKQNALKEKNLAKQRIIEDRVEGDKERIFNFNRVNRCSRPQQLISLTFYL